MDFVNPQNKIQEKPILIDNLKINYKIVGNGNIPVIILHGWGIDSDKYSAMIEHLSEIANGKLRIIAPDLPGFGKSDMPGKAWGVGEYARFIKKFMAAVLGDLISDNRQETKGMVLIGHSFGGRIAIKLAAEYPEKISALVLTGAAGIRHPLTIRQKILFVAAKTGKVIFSLPIMNYFFKAAEKILYKIAGEKDYFKARGVMKEVFKKVTSEDLTPYLEKISAYGGSAGGGKVPTLLIWGKEDRSTPLSDGKLMNSKIKDSRLEILDGVNHRAPYQKPEDFARIVAGFLLAIKEK